MNNTTMLSQIRYKKLGGAVNAYCPKIHIRGVIKRGKLMDFHYSPPSTTPRNQRRAFCQDLVNKVYELAQKESMSYEAAVDYYMECLRCIRHFNDAVGRFAAASDTEVKTYDHDYLEFIVDDVVYNYLRTDGYKPFEMGEHIPEVCQVYLSEPSSHLFVLFVFCL